MSVMLKVIHVQMQITTHTVYLLKLFCSVQAAAVQSVFVAVTATIILV